MKGEYGRQNHTRTFMKQNIRIYKFMAAMLAGTMLMMPIGAFANEIIDYSVDRDSVLTVKGKLDLEYPNVLVNFWMSKDGKIVCARQSKTNSQGEYIFTINMSSFDAGGAYSMQTVGQTEDIAKRDFTFYSAEELEKMYKDLFEHKSDKTYIADKLEGDYFGKFLFVNGDFKNVISEEKAEDTSSVISNELSKQENFSQSDVINALNFAATAKTIEAAADSDAICGYFTDDTKLEVLGLKNNKILEIFKANLEADSKSASDDKKDSIKYERYKELAENIINFNYTYASLEEFVDKTEDALVITDIKRCKGTKAVLDMINLYSGKTDKLDSSDFDGDVDVIKNIISKLENNKITTVKEIQSLLDAGGKSTDKSDSGSGGKRRTGGGSGSGFVSMPDKVINDLPNVTPDIKNFTDMAGYEWAENSVNHMAELGMLNGYSNDIFAPGENVTRAQFAKMMCSLFGIKEAALPVPFEDVEQGRWYTGYIAALYDAGYIKGTSESTFGTEDDISRQDAFTIIFSVLKDKDLIDIESSSADFADWEKVAEYAKSAIATLSDMGLVQGDGGNVAPENNMTRAEGAVIMHKVYERVIQ